MKKIFCIFLVVLILIMSTVPCFAFEYNSDDYQINFDNLLYNFDSNSLGNWRITSSAFSSYSVSNSILTFTITNNSSVLYDACVAQDIDLIAGHSYLAFYFVKSINFSPSFYTSGVSWFPSTYNISGTSYSLISATCTANSDIHASFYLGRVGSINSYRGNDVSIYNPCLIDITGFTGSVTDFLDDLQARGLSDQILSYGHNSFFKPDYFQPLLDFWLSFTHLFDYFGQLISTYSGLFVFVTICLSLCLVTFIVVMVIKRCRNI